MNNSKKKKSYQQLEQELKSAKAARGLEFLSKIFPPLFKWGGIAWIATKGNEAIQGTFFSLGGKVTAASIDLKASAALNPGDNCENWPYWIAAISAIIAIASVSYGISQKILRKLTVTHLAPYKEKYERLIDTNRTTSGLQTDGSTNPEDE